MLWSLFIIILSIYILLLILLYFFQSSFVYFPSKKLAYSPAEIGLDFEDVFMVCEDNIQLHGWYIHCKQKKGIVLFFHGNAGNISYRLDTIAMFTGIGYDVFIFDYRGYGKSQGKPSEEGTYLDALAAWNYLLQQRKVSGEKITIFARSLGAAVGSWLAKEKHVHAVILESSFASIPKMGEKLYPFLPTRLLAKIIYPVHEYVKHIQAPKLFIHSRDDEIIPFAQGYENYQNAIDPKQFLEIYGSHNDGFIQSRNIWVKGIQEFLSNYE
jgi:pimeloyl-ACP methyl ester carboxylesterase